MSSFRIKTAENNLPDLQNLAASLSVAISYATGINWFIPNFQAATETIGTSTITNATITNATITNLTATNLSTTNTFSISSATTFISGTIAAPTATQLLGGIIVLTGSTIDQINFPSGQTIYGNLPITTVGTTFEVLFINNTTGNEIALNVAAGGITLVVPNNSFGSTTTSVICKFVVSGVNAITIYG